MTIRTQEHFSSQYSEAKERFLVAANDCNAWVSGHAINARSLDDEELTIDTAYLGPESPACVLAISSGLHGVEGFAGSAIQHQLLRDHAAVLDLEGGTGLLLVHALNPFGFSALRRVNENNVDLNRNFVRHPDGHVANPGYEELYDAVNPLRLDDEEKEAESRAALGAFAKQHGGNALQAALSVGQYAHPEGMQFGGHEQEESNRWLRGAAREITRGAPRVVWLDVHTGLGAYGEVEMIMESAPDSLDFVRARSWWGDSVRSIRGEGSVSSAVHGSVMVGLAEELPDCDLTVVGAEFGTYDTARVFAAMRADNWVHRVGALDTEKGADVKRELVEVFRPSDQNWESRILGVGADLIGATMREFADGA